MRRVFILNLFLFVSLFSSPLYIPPLYKVKFICEGEPKVNQEFKVNLEVVSFENATTKIEIFLPNEFRVLAGNLYHEKLIHKNDTFKISLSLKIEKSGKFNIYAWVWTEELQYENFLRYDIENLYIISQDTTGFIFYSFPKFLEHIEPLLPELIDTTPIGGELFGYNVTIKGYIKYFNKDNGVNAYEPFPHARVQIISSTGQLIAQKHTDNEGFYSFSLNLSAGTYYVRVRTRNEACYINQGDYFSPQKEINITSSGTYWANINIIQSQAEWARILQNIYGGYKFSDEKLGWKRLYSIQVDYEEDGETYFWHWEFGSFHDEGIHVGKPEDVWNNPLLKDYYGTCVCTHEYGHAYMYEYYGWTLPHSDFSGTHYYCTVSDPNFAFTEGWAEFFSKAAVLYMFNEVYENYGQPENYYVRETGTGRRYWEGCNGQNTDGRKVEGAVMQVLWDLYDLKTFPDKTPNFDDEGWRNENSGILIRTALHFPDGSNVDNIQEFKSSWIQRNFGNFTPIYNINLFGILPSPPSNLTGTGSGNNYAKIEWEDVQNLEGGYIIFCKKQSEYQWSPIDTVDTDVTFYIPQEPIFEYTQFFVKTILGDTSLKSNIIGLGVNAPSNLHIISITENSVKLAWNDNSENEMGFKIEIKGGQYQNWTEIKTVVQNVTSTWIENLEFNTSYEFRVRAYAQEFYSEYSNTVSATINVLNSPTNLTATSPYPYDKVTLTWEDNSNYETGYEIWRKEIDQDWHKIDEVGENVTSYKVKGEKLHV